tara:strand:+ start:552 stop:902 length:351 start_codon:yes stop_codon:yes gene_type:complete
MNNKNKKTLNNIKTPKHIVYMYSFLAVLFVLIPEWLASLGISIEDDEFKSHLPYQEVNFNNLEIYLSDKSLYELRYLANIYKIFCYSNDNKNELRKRVMRKLKRKNNKYKMDNTKV